MKADYIITNYNSVTSAFLMEEGRLVKACPLYNGSILGNLYIAKVVNIVKSINAAFLDAGTGDYLYYPIADNQGKEIFTKHGNSTKLCEGDEILIQISKEPIKTKKGEATSNICIKGSSIIINRSGEIGVSGKICDEEKRNELKETLRKVIDKYSDIHAGAIIRTAADKIDIKQVVDEAETILCKLKTMIEQSAYMNARKLVYKVENRYLDYIKDIIVRQKYDDFIIVTDIEDIFDDIKQMTSNLEIGGTFSAEKNILIKLFSDNMTTPSQVYDIKTKLEKGMAKTIYLKSGGSIVVEPTEAMTVIDVNTGKAIRGKNTENTFLKINKEAAEMIARILRLRNLSGIIIIDFINMKQSENVRELVEHLKREIAKDEIKVNYVDMTSLGLVELTRKKESHPLTLNDFK